MENSKDFIFDWRLFWLQLLTVFNLMCLVSFFAMLFFPAFYYASGLKNLFAFDLSNFIPVLIGAFYIFCLLVSIRLFFSGQQKDKALVIAALPLIITLATLFLKEAF